MHRTGLLAYSSIMTGMVLAWHLSPAMGTDYESFEFNDSAFTELDAAVNTANMGNMWSTDINVLTDSFVQSGDYVIQKFNDLLSSNYLQIDNIDPNTNGSRFIVVEVSDWDIRGFDASNPEEIRFAFLTDDTGTSGSSVTAQMQIARNTTTQAIELVGDAIGVGSSDLSTTPTLNTAQSLPFTMVLELNKTSDSYEVFYNDGTNPSQSLGIGTVAPGRNGNSLRFVINNNFGFDPNESFAIDRIALTDTNPLTDLFTVEVERTTGAMKLINTTGSSLTGLQSYSITSGAGALDSAKWKPITGNYDESGNGSVDPNNDWAVGASTTIALSESGQGGNGGNLSISQEVVLSLDPNDGLWIQNPTEDLEVELMFTGGVTRRANVNFVGNGGARFSVGDLNFDGSLTAADWSVFIAGAETSLTGLSVAQAYQKGDLNNDGENNIFDFGIFKDTYDEINGLGAFEAMIAGVPEPSTLFLVGAGTLLVLTRRRKADRELADTSKIDNRYALEGRPMNRHKRVYLSILAIFLSTFPSSKLSAGISEDFQFDDSNGTLLENTSNSVVLAHSWLEDSADMSGSSVLNGVYRIQKDNEEFGTNYLETTNFTSGKAWLVAEIAGWNFTPTLGSGEVAEEIRFAFLNNDMPVQGNNTVTGQAQILRNGSGGIELVGKLTTGAPEFGPLALTQSRSDPFTVVVEIDEDNENYSVWYKDDTDPFVKLGTAPHVAGRDGNSVRFVANNHFGGTGEFFDIDRIYITDEDPINVSQDLLTLQVNLGTGIASVFNDTSSTFDIDSYRIESTSDDLIFANWSSFSDQNLDIVDGPDPNSTAGDGIGESWDEAAGSDDSVLAESFLLGSSIFDNGRSEILGSIFDTGGDPNSIVFQYRNADTGAIVSGNIEFVTTDADFNGDGYVDGTDFLIWQQNVGLGGQTDNSNGDADGNGTVGTPDLAAWEGQYGAAPLSAIATVPEPTTCVLLVLALASSTMTVRRRI